MIPVLLRGMAPRMLALAVLAVAAYFAEPAFHGHAEGAEEGLFLDTGALGVASTLSVYAGLGMILLLGGFVSNDRREGYYRLFFSHPTRPLAFYGLRWLLALGVVLAATTCFLVGGQLVAWGRFEGGWSGLWLALVTALAYGGLIAILSTVLPRGGTVLAILVFFFNFFWIMFGAPAPPGVLNDLMALLVPPQLALSDVYDGVLRGEVAWGASAFAAGYGVFWLIVAGVVLRLRDWP